MVQRTHHYAFMMKIVADQKPVTFKEATQASWWIKATSVEMRVVANNETWDLVPSSETDKKPIGYRWVFKIKHNADGTITSSSLAGCQGYSLTHSIDDEETFVPIAKNDYCEDSNYARSRERVALASNGSEEQVPLQRAQGSLHDATTQLQIKQTSTYSLSIDEVTLQT